MNVRASWDQIGGPPVRETKRVRIAAGKRKQVNFNLRVTSERLDRHQSVDQYPKCRVKATIIDTFGETSE